MASAPISIKLRCASWQQLASIYKRDLARNAIFLKSANPPALGTPVRIDLTLPSESMVVLTGNITKHIGEGELEGRGPGVDVKLNTIPQSAMWLIETALASAQKEIGKIPAGPSGATGSLPTIGAAAAAPSGAATPRLADDQMARRTPPHGTPPRPAAPPARPQSDVDAAIGDGNDLASAETELIVALTSELDSLKRLNPFQVLGLGYEATDSDVRTAFGELTKRYHPDRYARFQSPDLRNLAAEIFILIRDAYRRLGDEAARVQVVASLGPRRTMPLVATSSATARPGTPIPGATPRASTMQQQPPSPPSAQGKPPTVPTRPSTPRPVVAPVPRQSVAVPPVPVAARNVADPPTGSHSVSIQQPPTGAASIDSGKPPDLAMAEGMLDAGKYDEALAYFKLISKRTPQDRVARAGIELAEGMRAIAARDRLEAAQRFEAVLELDPANERAARELAEMRRLATNERKGMLSRLLGKKE